MFNELGYKGFPLGLNFFEYAPIPAPEPKAETYEELLTENQPVEIWPYAYISYDSRESSSKLATAVKKGLDALSVPFTDFEMQTIPCF